MVTNQLQARTAVIAQQQPGMEYSWERIVCSLDLISGLADGIGPQMAELLSKGQLRDLILRCCKVGSN